MSRNDEVNRQIRAGRGTPPEPRRPDAGERGQDGGREEQSTRVDAEAGPPQVSDLDMVKAIAAHEAGLPLEERRDAIRHRAIDIDQYRRMGGNRGGRDA